jgi:hypothetical protein
VLGKLNRGFESHPLRHFFPDGVILSEPSRQYHRAHPSSLRVTLDSIDVRFWAARIALGYHEGASAFGTAEKRARRILGLDISGPEVHG